MEMVSVRSADGWGGSQGQDMIGENLRDIIFVDERRPRHHIGEGKWGVLFDESTRHLHVFVLTKCYSS